MGRKEIVCDECPQGPGGLREPPPPPPLPPPLPGKFRKLAALLVGLWQLKVDFTKTRTKGINSKYMYTACGEKKLAIRRLK